MKSTTHQLFNVLALGMIATGLHAQDFYSTTTSARSQAVGGVYIPSTSGVLDALATNPAGLSTLSTRTVDLSVTSVFARGSFTNSVNQNAPLQNSPGVMPYGAFGMPIGHSRFTIGVGLVPELMSVSDWKYVDAPGAAGATYGLQTQKSAILSARSVTAVSYSLSPALSLGASIGIDYNSNQLTAPYIFQQHPALAGLKTLLDLHTHGIGRNYSVGILASPSKKVQFGVAWKSRTVIDSDGTASGNIGAQLAAVGLVARPDFAYSAAVRNLFPQSMVGHILWQVDRRWNLAFQTNWVNWKDAFVTLPVALTNGTNADINGLLGTNTLNDGVPLHWKDQFSFHGGIERLVTENVTMRGGYAHGNSPVPNSTLSPLTAAIMKDQLTTGVGLRRGRVRYDLGYGFGFQAHQSVGQSSLLSGEYSNSRVGIGTQALTFNTSFQF
jgi:long-subunit fatty acid transport protein